MKPTVFLRVAVLGAALACSSLSAEDELSGQGILATAKIAGACGIMDSLIYFQKTTKLKGGDDFVARFWAFEAARLGLSVQEYSDRCNSAVGAYDQMWKASEAENE